ncbi:hypothetical protein PTTG_02931 [Puccinia triticina 1-1 BBBD Race 1]|uniref:Uncharacterized protein n=1 Tax=Puccinia triticina (isolate 1-1 / race 1 (BBBD)) TaxID=630390 RepID=A0A180GD70_PUCT1|nr:hypothetical protein PTTG_02931 [Puccinia triticina 1-1 BBBD Race 1]
MVNRAPKRRRAMAEPETINPAAQMVRDFRAKNAGGKSEDEYQELIKRIIQHLLKRLMDHGARTAFTGMRSRDDNVGRSRNETSYHLRQNLLPRLKERMWSLTLAMDPRMATQGDFRAWYDQILEHLVEIDNILEQIDLVIGAIYAGEHEFLSLRGPAEDNPRIQELTPFSTNKIKHMVKHLLNAELRLFLHASKSFFIEFRFATSSKGQDRSMIEKWREVYQAAAGILGEIDGIVGWLGKPLIEMAKEEWEELIVAIDDLLDYLLRVLERDLIGSLSPTGEKFCQLTIPVVKLCRIYFNKFSRLRSSTPLIFIGGSMQIEVAQLRELLSDTKDTGDFIDDFVHTMTGWPSSERQIKNVFLNLVGGFVESSGVLIKYWESLLSSPDHRTPDEQQKIQDAQRWDEEWTDAFYKAAGAVQEEAEGLEHLDDDYESHVFFGSFGISDDEDDEDEDEFDEDEFDEDEFDEDEDDEDEDDEDEDED